MCVQVSSAFKTTNMQHRTMNEHVLARAVASNSEASFGVLAVQWADTQPAVVRACVRGFIDTVSV